MNDFKKIPEVSTLRFLRHSINILKNPLPFHQKNFSRHGDTFRLNIGLGSHAIFSRDAALAEYVLQKNWKNYTKSPIQTKDLAKYLGKGLLTAEGEHWRTQRKLIQPAFHKKQLNHLLATIRKTMVDEIGTIENDVERDVLPFFSDLAFKVVVKSLFSNAATEEEIKMLQEVTEENQEMLVRELRQPYLKWYFNAFGIIKKHLARSNESRNILQNIINRRKQSKETFNDLLDMLLEARYDDGSQMSDQQLIDEILVLFVAGHETTANALSFAVQLLAQHPEWQTRLAKDYKSILRQNDGDIMKIVVQLQSAKQVVEETMRLYPPAYFIDRVNIQDDEFNGFQFKKGSSLLFSIYEIHRHKRLWDNSEDFKPDRFEPEKAKNYSSQYFPFGAGPRKCIGNNFAMYEMILAISELLLKFTIHPTKDTIGINPLITLKPKNAVVKFQINNS